MYRSSGKRDKMAMTIRAQRIAQGGPSGISYTGWQRKSPTAMLGEKKVIDINSAAYAFQAVGAPPTPLLLNGVVAGSQNFNRIGRKTEMKSIQLRGVVSATTEATANDTGCRMVLVYDKQANGNAPTWANVIQSQNIAGTTSSTFSDMVNLDNRDRFVILRDKFFIMAYQSIVATEAGMGSNTVCTIEDYVKINLETIFNAGTAGTVGDITTGSLHVFFVGSVAAQYTFTGSFRVRFVDL